jgi:hypothetical protein
MRGPDAAPIRSHAFYGDLGRDLEDTATLYTPDEPRSTRSASSLATTTFTSSAASGKRTLSWRCSCTGYRQQKCNRKALRFYQVQHSAVVQIRHDSVGRRFMPTKTARRSGIWTRTWRSACIV